MKIRHVHGLYFALSVLLVSHARTGPVHLSQCCGREVALRVQNG